jgi:hypothetical protein
LLWRLPNTQFSAAKRSGGRPAGTPKYLTMAQWRVSVTAASHWAVFIRYGNNPRPRSTSFIAGTAADCLRLGGSIECIVRTPAKTKPIGSEKRAGKFNWHRGVPKMFAIIQIDDRLGRCAKSQLCGHIVCPELGTRYPAAA